MEECVLKNLVSSFFFQIILVYVIITVFYLFI